MKQATVLMIKVTHNRPGEDADREDTFLYGVFVDDNRLELLMAIMHASNRAMTLVGDRRQVFSIPINLNCEVDADTKPRLEWEA